MLERGTPCSFATTRSAVASAREAEIFGATGRSGKGSVSPLTDRMFLVRVHVDDEVAADDGDAAVQLLQTHNRALAGCRHPVTRSSLASSAMPKRRPFVSKNARATSPGRAPAERPAGRGIGSPARVPAKWTLPVVSWKERLATRSSRSSAALSRGAIVGAAAAAAGSRRQGDARGDRDGERPGVVVEIGRSHSYSPRPLTRSYPLCTQSDNLATHLAKKPPDGWAVLKYRHGDSNPGFRRERAAS